MPTLALMLYIIVCYKCNIHTTAWTRYRVPIRWVGKKWQDYVWYQSGETALTFCYCCFCYSQLSLESKNKSQLVYENYLKFWVWNLSYLCDVHFPLIRIRYLRVWGCVSVGCSRRTASQSSITWFFAPHATSRRNQLSETYAGTFLALVTH